MDNYSFNDLAADTELTLGFPGNPSSNKSRRVRLKQLRAENSSSDDVNNRPAGGRHGNIGWPPVRGHKKKDEEEDEYECLCILVKVAVDGAPFLRKVDLGVFSTYHDLLRALLEMFSSNCFTNIPTTWIKEEEMMIMMMRNRVVVNGIEYIPTYEDKDGDWMLLGDVPWEMFKKNCKRIRLVKS